MLQLLVSYVFAIKLTCSNLSFGKKLQLVPSPHWKEKKNEHSFLNNMGFLVLFNTLEVNK